MPNKKYLKYKQKYLELKNQMKQMNQMNQMKQINQYGGERVRTIPNTGSLEGMTNQCFLISVLQYLQRNGHPALTLTQLKRLFGLGPDTDNMMFDVDERNDRGHVYMFNAAAMIALNYGLRIEIVGVRQDGEVLGPRGVIGNGPNHLRIAQYGLAHFELIDDVNGNQFVGKELHNGLVANGVYSPSEIFKDVAQARRDEIKALEISMIRNDAEVKKKKELLRKLGPIIDYTKQEARNNLERDIEEINKQILRAVSEIDKLRKVTKVLNPILEHPYMRHQQITKPQQIAQAKDLEEAKGFISLILFALLFFIFGGSSV